MDVFSEKFMKDAFSQSTYYILLLLFLTWFLSLIGYIASKRLNFKDFFRKYWPGLAVSLALTSAVFVSVQAYPRVLSDETNLLSVAQSMTFDRRVSNVIEGRMNRVNYQVLRSVEEKRPYLTPFMYHLVNVFMGYDARHAFVANFIALFILYFLIYVLVASGFGALWGVAGVLLVASQPILSICATSCGMDFLNTVLILAAFMSLREYLKTPSPASFLFLWMNLCLLAHARYESVLYFGFVLCGLIILRKIHWEYFRTSFSYALTPVFLFPIIYQRIISWHDKELPGESVSTAFGFHDFLSHNKQFLKLLLNTDFFIPIAVAVNLVGVIAFIYFTVRLIIKKDVLKESFERHAVWLFLAPVAVLWVVTTAYYFGRVDNPVSVRLFLPYLVILSAAAAFLMAHLSSSLGKDARYGIMIALAAFIVYHPVAIKDRFSLAISTGREQRYVLKFLESQPDKRFLIISPYSNLFTPYQYSSIGFGRANRRPNRILRQYKERLFREIFVMQMIETPAGKLKEGMELSNKFKLETVSELQFRSGEYVRISRVVNPR